MEGMKPASAPLVSPSVPLESKWRELSTARGMNGTRFGARQHTCSGGARGG